MGSMHVRSSPSQNPASRGKGGGFLVAVEEGKFASIGKTGLEALPSAQRGKGVLRMELWPWRRGTFSSVMTDHQINIPFRT